MKQTTITYTDTYIVIIFERRRALAARYTEPQTVLVPDQRRVHQLLLDLHVVGDHRQDRLRYPPGLLPVPVLHLPALEPGGVPREVGHAAGRPARADAGARRVQGAATTEHGGRAGGGGGRRVRVLRVDKQAWV